MNQKSIKHPVEFDKHLVWGRIGCVCVRVCVCVCLRVSVCVFVYLLGCVVVMFVEVG